VVPVRISAAPANLDPEIVAQPSFGSALLMGGDITVASEPGKGSVLTVRLPGGQPS
jgi:hypothetical protein